MLIADKIVLTDETRVGTDYNLELRREALDYKGVKLSRTKTEDVECKLSNKR